MPDKAPIFKDRRPQAPSRKRTPVYGMWYGGGSYAVPHPDEAEEFKSMAHAKHVFEERRRGHDPISGLRTPVVDENSEMHLFLGGTHPREMNDPYPDRIIKVGRRGSARTEYA